MPVKRKIPYSNGHFFITFTCYNWLPLLECTSSYDLVYKWFTYLKQQGHFITGYCIMPNHLHALIGFTESEKSIFRNRVSPAFTGAVWLQPTRRYPEEKPQSQKLFHLPLA